MDVKAKSVKVEVEELTRATIADLELLLPTHAEEAKSEKLKVDWLSYQVMQKSGEIAFVSARMDGELVGYILHMIFPDMHVVGKVVAMNDAIYVCPSHRGRYVATRLMKVAEEEVKRLGAHSIGQSVKVHHDFGKILCRQGYIIDEHYYTKELL